jgi:hypothetical protein
MEILNLPTAEQFAEQILVLREISGKMGIVDSIASWADVQAIVRRGQASKYFSAGDALVANYDSNPVVWNVIGINHDTPTDSARTYSLTIQARDCLQNVQFDAPEPTNPDANRQLYGNNRYIHSAIRQWLNSNAATFTWVSQHAYDAAPTGAPYNGPGYLARLDPDLVAVIGAVNKQVAKATVDGGGQDLFSDKVFLLSRVEVYGTSEGTVTGESPYAFYDNLASSPADGALAGRIKLLSSTPRYWWLRSPNVGSSHFPRIVRTLGEISSNYASDSHGLAPACCII